MNPLDNGLNDELVTKRKFYKTKRFWSLVALGIGGLLLGDYQAILPVVSEIANGVLNG